MKLKVFYIYFKFFIWVFLISNFIEIFCIVKDHFVLFVALFQDLVFLFFFLDTYNNLDLPDDCKTWKEYYDSLIELKKQPMTKEDKKILELFIPPD